MPLLSTSRAHPPHPLKTIQWVGSQANDVRMRDFLHRLLTADRPYLWLEGTYLGMRPGGRITAVAVMVAAAVNTEGRQDLRPFIGPAEAEAFRGGVLRGPKLAGLSFGIIHDCRRVREAQVNLAIRRFAGFGLHDRLPDRSSLTRIRWQQGAEWFRSIFQRTVRACICVGIARDEIVHVLASSVRVGVSWDSTVLRHVDAFTAVNDDADANEAAKRKTRNSKTR